MSINSAKNVYAAIDDAKFDVVPVYIDERGHWWQLDQFDDEIILDEAEQIMPVLGAGGFAGMESGNVVRPDVILPVLHGHGGEDGSVQGLSQLLHVPIVGCDIASSAVCMDKDLTKHLLMGAGTNVAAHKSIMKHEKPPKFADLVAKLGETMFVKPSRQGSSVGVSRVTNDAELANALDEAFRYDNQVLVERAIVGRELEVAVLGNAPLVEASDVGEVVAENFYDYDTKYAAGSTAKIAIPADLNPETRDEIRMQALQVFEILNCSGLARVDFFLDKDGVIYVNEVNTLPGFTNISMYPKLWINAGVSYPELIEKLIDLAL